MTVVAGSSTSVGLSFRLRFLLVWFYGCHEWSPRVSQNNGNAVMKASLLALDSSRS